METFDLMEEIIPSTTNPRRVGIIPSKIRVEIGLFREELSRFNDDPDGITLLVQHVGSLAKLGQYGYVDMLNEQYIAYDENSSPNAVKFDHFRELMLDNIRMLKEDFFDTEIERGDIDGAQFSIEDMESIEMWAKLTDQFKVDDILERVQDYLEEMYPKFNKIKEEE